MSKRGTLTRVGALLFLVLAFGVTACQPSPTATPTAAATTPLPTATVLPTETAAPTGTIEPTDVPPSPTAVPVPSKTPPPPIATTKIVTNVRAGPGVSFALIGKLQSGVSNPILGKDPDSQWWQITYQDKPGWIAADFTDVKGGINGVPVIAVEAPATETPVPTDVAIARLQPTDTPTADIPPAAGRIYFVVKQADDSYTTAWVRPTNKEQVFSDVILGTAPGDLSTVLSTNASPLAWSDKVGKLAYVIGSGTQNKLQTIDQEQNVADLASHAAIVSPRWFADGKQLAYIGYDNNLQNQKIYIVGADGLNRKECFGARPGETLRGLAVSPADGTIVFVSNLTGAYELWSVGADCGTATQLTKLNADTTAPAFSPDGKQIAFVSNQAGPTEFDMYLMQADGSNIRPLIGGFSPVFSPDGMWLAFSQNGEVYIMDITGNRIQTVAPGYAPAWAKE